MPRSNQPRQLKKTGIGLIIDGQQLHGLTETQAKAVLSKDWLKCHGSIEKDGNKVDVNSPGIHIDVAAGKVMYFDDKGKVVRRRPLADAAVEAMALVQQFEQLGFSIKTEIVRAADAGQA